MKTIYCISSLMFLFFSCSEINTHSSSNHTRSISSDTAYSTKNIILVVIDGPRYSETWGDPSHQYIPHMAKDLAKEGVVFTNFYNDGYTYTNSGHAAVTTGHRQEINNSGKEFPKYPSLFQYYLKKTDKSKTAAWVITSKGKLEVLSNTTHPDWKNKFLPSANSGINGSGVGYRNDPTTYTVATEILKKHHPNLVLINFKEPDASGHANKWSDYLQGIVDTDAYVWELWKFIQADSIYKDKTTLFVTNDHGRHLDTVADGFVSHGCSCEGCRHINLYAYGPDFKKNKVVVDTFALQDVAATSAYLMQLEMPYSEGKIIKDLFK